LTTDTRANDASTDAQAEGSNVPDACPTGRGPAMVNVDSKTCIDSTEVTVAQYRAFFGAVDAGNFPQPPECSWNTTFDPNGGVPIGKDLNPMDNVNWCKARAFCTWAGKSLCGSPDGGAFPYASFADSTQSVWMRACSNGVQSYPYGNTLHTSYCNLTPT
jgi:sulfatase modifying factor 1